MGGGNITPFKHHSFKASLNKFIAFNEFIATIPQQQKFNIMPFVNNLLHSFINLHHFNKPIFTRFRNVKHSVNIPLTFPHQILVNLLSCFSGISRNRLRRTGKVSSCHEKDLNSLGRDSVGCVEEFIVQQSVQSGTQNQWSVFILCVTAHNCHIQSKSARPCIIGVHYVVFEVTSLMHMRSIASKHFNASFPSGLRLDFTRVWSTLTPIVTISGSSFFVEWVSLITRLQEKLELNSTVPRTWWL